MPVPWNPSDATPMTVNGCSLSVNVWPTMPGSLAEATRPETVTQDDDWTRPGLVTVARADQPPHCRNGSEHTEIVDRHEAAEMLSSTNTRTGPATPID